MPGGTLGVGGGNLTFKWVIMTVSTAVPWLSITRSSELGRCGIKFCLGQALGLAEQITNPSHSFFLSFFFFEFLSCIYFSVQQVLISHPFYTHQCIHVNPNLPIHHTTTPPRHFPLLVPIHLFSTSQVTVSLSAHGRLCRPVVLRGEVFRVSG